MNEELRDAVLVFCERQLAGAIDDAESAVSGVNAAFMAVRYQAVEFSVAQANGDRRASELLRHIDKVVTSLQFFDAHAQRVRHVSQMLDLLITDHARRPHQEVPQAWRPVLEKLRAVLSTEAEWRIFGEMFPGEDAGHHAGDCVELY
jgi:hypothetical protein